MAASRPAPASGQVRLAELLAALSLATDLADGFPPETALKTCLIAVAVGRELGLTGQPLSDVYYAALLRYLGCTSTAHESTHVFGGDDVALRGAFAGIDFEQPREIVRAFRQLGRGGRRRSVRALGGLLAQGLADRDAMWHGVAAECEAQSRLARRLGLGEEVAVALEHSYSLWNGKGFPRGLDGERIPRPARISYFSHVVEQHLRRGGDRRTVLMKVHGWAGGQVDPEVAHAFLGRADGLLAMVAAESVWDAVLEAEPEPRPWIPLSQLDQLVQAFGDFADLKSIYSLGHSSGVATLAASAAAVCGLSDSDVAALRRAGHLHDLGRVGVSNGIWDKRGPLNAAEWERVRLHPYHTERVLAHAPALAPLARLAGSDHERLDGSGYHRGLTAGAIPKTARVLAAADAYQAMVEERPHRAALDPAAAASQLSAEAAAGRLDGEVVRAVLEAAGHRALSQRGQWPAGLSDREVEVLRLAAHAKTNQEIGQALFISPRTVHHHVQHIYQKIGVSSRAGAALFAMEHDLLAR